MVTQNSTGDPIIMCPVCGVFHFANIGHSCGNIQRIYGDTTQNEILKLLKEILKEIEELKRK